jgi:small subunit ribosomal protein S6
MQKYEIMFIIKPNMEEENIKKVAQDFADILEKNGAKIIDRKEYGQKELAYEIKKHKSGYYFVYQVEASNAKAIEEFNRLALISEDIIRHMIIKLEN